MSAVIETHNLSKSFGKRRAVDGLSLSVERGDVFGFLGPNGAGKSTTIRILVGLVKPDGGHASVLGHDTWSDRKRALRRVGSLVETPGLYKFLTGRENLALVSRMSGFTDGAVARALELVGLADRADDKVKSYSHGMRQRLAIAQSLVGEPELLILDEPASALDPIARGRFLDLLLQIIQNENRTIIISSHILSDIEKVIDHTLIMQKGRLLRNCSFDCLREEFTRFILTSLNGPLPAALPFANTISCEISGSNALITVQHTSQENLETQAKNLNCQIEIRPLSLEEIYRIVVS